MKATNRHLFIICGRGPRRKVEKCENFDTPPGYGAPLAKPPYSILYTKLLRVEFLFGPDASCSLSCEKKDIRVWPYTSLLFNFYIRMTPTFFRI